MAEVNQNPDTVEWVTMQVPELRDFIERNLWVYARTMPQCPHEYVTLWHSSSEEAFFRFVSTVRRYGYDQRFFSRTHRYLDLGGWKYWTMGDELRTTWILNRARHDGPPHPKLLNKKVFATNPPNHLTPPHTRRRA
jgi:hypothetical protein